jgi:lipoic acid synthetase
VAAAVETMGLDYVVVTSVTRDDLPDGGASWFAKTIREIHERIPDLPVETLVPDFMGSKEAIRIVVESNPAVLNHNIETVPRLYGTVRPEADYARSLELLACTRGFNADLPVKSGLMLGLGETEAEIRQTLADLLNTGCTLLTLGQYLQPSKAHLPVARFLAPEEFENWRIFAVNMGFTGVASGPFVRSSYQAKQLYETLKGATLCL